jgi:hypothetical protein
MTTARPRFNLRTIPWHPVLLATVVVIAFWMDAVVSPYPVFRPFVIAVVGMAGLTLLAGAVLRNWHAGGVLATTLLGVLYAKHLVRLVLDLGPAMPVPVLLLWLAAMLLVAALLTRLAVRTVRRLTWADATWLLNRLALVLLVATLMGGLLTGSLWRGVAQLSWGETPASGQPATAANPDIYVILLDGYPRADVLQHALGHYNTPFTGALEQRGFDVADAAHSDYLWTHVSLTSLLNMAYIEQIETLQPVVAGRAPLYPPVTEAINRNPVFDAARERGYQVVAIGSGYEQLTPRSADVFLDTDDLNEFEVKLLNSTFLGDIVSVVLPGFAAGQHAERIRGTLDHLVGVAEAPHDVPRLVVAHVPTPHQPSVFRADGSTLSVPLNDAFYADSAAQKGQTLAAFSEEYREHLTYVNQLILDALDDVLTASTRPPVVVLVADHGAASQVDWRYERPDTVEPAVLLERTGILFAALTPERTGVFPDDISPVNVFRYLFDAYFETQLGPASPPPDGGQIPPVDAAVLE